MESNKKQLFTLSDDKIKAIQKGLEETGSTLKVKADPVVGAYVHGQDFSAIEINAFSELSRSHDLDIRIKRSGMGVTCYFA